MRTCAAVIGLSMMALLLGATAIGIFTAGPIGVFAGPMLAIFGWFYLVPIAIVVSAAMVIAERPLFQKGAGACVFVLAGAMIGSLFMAVFGVKEIGNAVRYAIAYAIGGGLSGTTVAGLIVRFRRLSDREQAKSAQSPGHE